MPYGSPHPTGRSVASARSPVCRGRGIPFTLAVVPLLLLLAGCAGTESEPTEIASRAPAAEVAMAGPSLPPAVGLPPPGRALVTLSGDHEYSADAAVSCGFALDPAAGEGGSDLRIWLEFDQRTKPALMLTVPAYSGAGEYTAALSLRLATDDGTFTESTGPARVSLTSGAASEGPTWLSGELGGEYSGAAGEGRMSGRFGACEVVTAPSPVVAGATAAASPSGPAP